MIYGFIPARAGSTSIPGKNLKKFNGVPLIMRLCEQFSLSLADKIIVATDSHKIAEEVSVFPKVLVYARTDESATSEAPTDMVLLEWLEYGVPNHSPDDIVVMGQCTSPYTKWENINGMIGGIQFGHHDSMISVAPFKRFTWKKHAGKAIPSYNPKERPRRQDMRDTFIENGALYASTVGAITKSGCRISGDIGLHIMSHDFELDEPIDWEIGELIMRGKGGR